MNDDRDVVLFRIDRKAGILLVGVMSVVLGGFALSEQLTLTTSYPVPSGIYNQLITTGDSGTAPADTTLNRNAGNTILVPATNASGKVGIGMVPVNKLDVAGGLGAVSAVFFGGVKLGDDASACTSAKEGTLRWHGGALEACVAAQWTRTGGTSYGGTYITCDTTCAAPNTWTGNCSCWSGSSPTESSRRYYVGSLCADSPGSWEITYVCK